MRLQVFLKPFSYKQVMEHFIKKGLSPKEVALGLAVGNFVGILPFLGFHTVLGILAAYLLRLNQLVVFLGAQISNPLSFPLIVFLSAQIGSLVLNGRLLELKMHDVGIVRHYLLPTVLGSVILGALVGAFSYFFAIRIFKRFKQ